MTKEKAKDFLPLLQAMAEGKTIQKIRDHYFWSDYNERIDGAIENIPIENLRIKPKFFVFKKNDGTYYKSTEFEHNTKGANWQFEGDEEECEEWIEEHTKKTWLEETLKEKRKSSTEYTHTELDMYELGYENGIIEVCEKLLDEVKNNCFKSWMPQVSEDVYNVLSNLIKDLGVEV